MKTEERRDFLIQSMHGIGIALCAGTLGSLLHSCEMNEDSVTPDINTLPFDIDLSKPEYSSLSVIGGAVYANDPNGNNGNDIIIIRLEQERFLVVSSICTHQECSVNLPSSDKPTLFCPCHFAEFSPLNGEVLVQPKMGTASTLPVFRYEFDKARNMLKVYLPGNG
ncbi:MAG: Rieske (2Fe-2S) protein [Ignavibacteria bacterium]